MKKIVFIMPHVTGKGGTENVVKTVMQLLQRKDSGYNPHLYILGGSEDKEWLNGLNYTETVFSNYRVIRNLQNLMSINFYLYKYLKVEKPDIVITTHSILSFLVNRIRKLMKDDYPNVSWIHFSLDAKNVKKNLLLYSDYHLAISTGNERQFSNLGVPDSKVYTIFNPVEPSDSIIPRPKNQTAFLYVGRVTFDEEKRMRDLLEALSRVTGDWRLDVIGDGGDVARCKRYAEQLKIAGNINWHGWIVNPWDYIKEATALVLTSSYEGFGMVLAEGISRGVYSISSDYDTGPADIIKKDLNGDLYKPDNLAELHNILQNIVDGKVLPDQKAMKETIHHFYVNQYYTKLLNALNDINIDWYEEKNVKQVIS